MINQNRKPKTVNRKLAACILLLFVSIAVNAQYVTITDTAFVHRLQVLFPACMNGSQMDTTCPDIVNARNLLVANKNISSVVGVQYFDNLKKFDCNQNNLTSLPRLPSKLASLICNRNHLVSLPNLPLTLHELDFSTNSITTLPALPDSIEVLRGDHNHIAGVPALPAHVLICDLNSNSITSLPTLPDSLEFFNVSYNRITAVPALPGTLRLLDCFGNLLTTLPALPDSLRTLSCGFNHFDNTFPPLNSALKDFWCGEATFSVFPILPSNLDWFGCTRCQFTSLPPLPNSLTRLDVNYNSLTSLPPLPPHLVHLWCHENPNLTCLPYLPDLTDLMFTNTAVTCIPNYAVITNCTPPLNSLPLCDPFNNNGCTVYWNINGNVYQDNGNCAQDSAETNIINAKVMLYKNGVLAQQTYSTVAGLYSFDTDTGTFSMTIDTTGIPFEILCPAGRFDTSVITPADSLDYDKDFGILCKPGFDFEARSIVTGVFRPAAQSGIDITAGDVAQFYGGQCVSGVSGTVTVTITGPLTYVSPATGARTPTSVNNNVITYSIADWGTVNIFGDFNILLRTDTTAQQGQQVCITVSLTPTAGDRDVSNNTLTRCFTVVNSLDPNDKQVYPEGNIDTTQEWLTYTIRFQNTGSAAAQHIYIDDTLDTNLDEATFQLLAYSHEPFVQLKLNAMRFNFPNINLPDSTANEPNSHGYVQYKVKLKENLPLGTEISNTAAIYFDFNAPVITNTTVNTIAVLAPPVATITSSANNICAGASATLTADGGIAYLWSTGNTTASMVVTPDSTTSYSVTVTDEHGSTATTDATVTVNDLPQPTITQSSDTLTTGNFSNYQWTLNGSPITNATAQELRVTQNGDYSVIVTDATGCSATSAVKNVTGVGVGELMIDAFRWMMYPNPATNAVTISIDESMVGSTLTMCDITGKKMTEVLLITHNQQLNIESFANGVYLVTVTLKEGGSVTRKLMK